MIQTLMAKKESHKKYNWPSKQDFKSKFHLSILGVKLWPLEPILKTLLKQVIFENKIRKFTLGL